MSLLKRLWNWLVSKTSTAPKLAAVEEEAVAAEEPTPVEVEEEKEEEEEGCAGDLFYQICRQAKVGHHELVKNGIVESFEVWYDGDCNEQSIRNSIPQFRKENPGVISAKLAQV